MQPALQGGNSVSEPAKKKFSAMGTIFFMVVLSFAAALILSVLASSLRPLQQTAMELDQSKEMLKAAQVLNHEGYFQLLVDKTWTPAVLTQEGLLTPAKEIVYPTSTEILDIYNRRIVPKLVNDEGMVTTFEEAGIDENNYLAEYKAQGYYTQKWKLFYELLPNSLEEKKPVGYIFPVNGFGLWDAIYGYIAIKPDGDTVMGISWYEQKETPGLGANIADWDWQKDFPGKKIFHENASGKTDFATAPLGIQVVRGKVSEVYGDSPKAASAVDGMAGATLTGNGVTEAYEKALSAYRPFLIQLHNEEKS